MDMVTGAHVAVALAVPVSRERMWDLVTAVGRIGEWSPEATGGSWCDDASGPVAGARFVGHNRFPNGSESTVTSAPKRSGRGRSACVERSSMVTTESVTGGIR